MFTLCLLVFTARLQVFTALNYILTFYFQSCHEHCHDRQNEWMIGETYKHNSILQDLWIAPTQVYIISIRIEQEGR